MTDIIDYLKFKGFNNINKINYNLPISKLIEDTIIKGQGQLTSTGALSIKTGEFTGRSPKDRFIVEDDITKDTIWWGEVNIKFDSKKFDQLYDKVIHYLNDKELFIRDLKACSEKKYQLNVRVITEYSWSNLFVENMFISPSKKELENFNPEWSIISAPGFKADPKTDGTRQHNFAILNFSRKILLIGGTGYTGEMKKGIFSVLNFTLPKEKNVLPMHCSSNIGENNDVAIFFGLSGTGKTTLSSDENRKLIGDDEHGWTENSVFNFEGGCYAKCINLSEKKEPQIFKAIKYGALVENIKFYENSDVINFEDDSITENTRVSYPIEYINNIVQPSMGGIPNNIFFLTADAFGVLPPISKLTPEQAMYHFISGYTAKVAGTEEGVKTPQATFSACFGSPFLPLHPTKYAEMLGEKMKQHNTNIWLLNTGWIGGPYGIGKRISLEDTRNLINAAIKNLLNHKDYSTHEIFKLHIPNYCPKVDSKILNPSKTWNNENEYNKKAILLAKQFNKNFEKYSDFATKEMLEAAPKS